MNVNTRLVMQMIRPQKKKEEKKNTLPPLGSSEGAGNYECMSQDLVHDKFKKNTDKQK